MSRLIKPGRFAVLGVSRGWFVARAGRRIVDRSASLFLAQAFIRGWNDETARAWAQYNADRVARGLRPVAVG